MVIKVSDTVKIYCPNCKRKVANYNKFSTMPLVRNCKKCKKQIIYYPETGEIKVKKIPQRNTSSGITFM